MKRLLLIILMAIFGINAADDDFDFNFDDDSSGYDDSSSYMTDDEDDYAPTGMEIEEEEEIVEQPKSSKEKKKVAGETWMDVKANQPRAAIMATNGQQRRK